MKYPHSIPLWGTNGEPLPGDIPSRKPQSALLLPSPQSYRGRE